MTSYLARETEKFRNAGPGERNKRMLPLATACLYAGMERWQAEDYIRCKYFAYHGKCDEYDVRYTLDNVYQTATARKIAEKTIKPNNSQSTNKSAQKKAKNKLRVNWKYASDKDGWWRDVIDPISVGNFNNVDIDADDEAEFKRKRRDAMQYILRDMYADDDYIYASDKFSSISPAAYYRAWDFAEEIRKRTNIVGYREPESLGANPYANIPTNNDKLKQDRYNSLLAAYKEADTEKIDTLADGMSIQDAKDEIGRLYDDLQTVKRTNDNIKHIRNVIIEFDVPVNGTVDEIGVDKFRERQRKFFWFAKKCLPVVLIVDTAGKGYHGYVKVNATKSEWGEIEDELKALIDIVGADTMCARINQMGRMPLGLREGKPWRDGIQRILHFQAGLAPLTATDFVDKFAKMIDATIEDDMTLVYTEKTKGKTDKQFVFSGEMAIKALADMGYCKQIDGKNVTYLLVDDGVMDETTIMLMANALGDYIKETQPDCYDAYVTKDLRHVTEAFAMQLPTADIAEHRDTRDATYLYFANGVLEVTANNADLMPYAGITGAIWKNAAIARDYVASPSDGDFKQFVRNICNGDDDRMSCLMTSIGGLINRYKDKAEPWAVVYTDEAMDDDNGGTGKGILLQAVGQLRKVQSLDFKGRGNDKFMLQGVEISSSVIHLEDVDRRFDFESIFNLISGDMEIENKGQPRFSIPFDKSPKIAISTNFLFRGKGSSHARRKKEFEIANYYSHTHRPIDDFKRVFFCDEWTDDDWNAFYSFVVECLQAYHRLGVKPWVSKTFEDKSLLAELGDYVVDYFDDFIDVWASTEDGGKIFNTNFLDDFKPYHGGRLTITITNLKKKLKIYADAKGYEIIDRSDKGGRLTALQKSTGRIAGYFIVKKVDAGAPF